MSRLKHAYNEYDSYDLSSQADDIANLYGQVKEYVRLIKIDAEDITEIVSSITEDQCYYQANAAEKTAYNIYEYTSAIYENGGVCKNAGIHNEDQLRLGNEYIKNLEAMLYGVEEELNNVEHSNNNFRYQIEQIEMEIQNAERILSELENMEREAKVTSRLKKTARDYYPYICAVHDDFVEQADNINAAVENIISYLQSLAAYDADEDGDFEQFKNDLVDPIKEEIDRVNTALDTIEHGLNIGDDMNMRMNNGIDRKKEKIEELIDSIENIKSQIESLTGENTELESDFNDLSNTLDELNDMIA